MNPKTLSDGGGRNNEVVDETLDDMTDAVSKIKEGSKVKREILRKRTTGASKKVTQSPTYGENTTIREYVSRKRNQLKRRR